MLVMNKIDVTRLEDLTPENRALVDEVLNAEGVLNVQVSCYTEEGVMELKNKACDALLQHRVDNKLKGNKVNSILNRLHVAQPKARDDVVREPFIPDAVKDRKRYDKDDAERRKLEKDIEAEEGGPGVYNIDLKSTCLLLFNPEVADDRDLQKTTSSPTPTGNWTPCLRSWTAKTLRTSSIPIFSRSSKPSSVKKRSSRPKGSMTKRRTWFVYLHDQLYGGF